MSQQGEVGRFLADRKAVALEGIYAEAEHIVGQHLESPVRGSGKAEGGITRGKIEEGTGRGMIGLARLSDGPSRLGSIVLCGDLLHKEVGMGGKTQALAMDLHEEGVTLLGLKAETVPIAGGKEAPTNSQGGVN